MATRVEIARALKRADEAGNEDDARRLAAALRALPEEDFEFSGQKMLRNLPGSVLREAEASFAPLIGGVQKLIPGEQRYESAFDVTRKMLTALAALAAPGIDATEEEKALLGDAGRAFIDTYTSREQFLRTLQDDPARIVSDLSLFLSAGGTAAARAPGMAGRLGRGAATVGKGIDPVNVLQNTVRGPAGEAFRRFAPNAPAEAFERVTKPPTTIPFRDRRRATLAALREGITPSERGLNKLRRRIDALEDQIQLEVNKAAKTGKRVSTQRIIDKLDEVEADMQQPTRLNQDFNVRRFKRFADPIRKRAEALGDASVDELLEIKRDLTGQVDFKSMIGKQPNQAIQERALLTAAGGARELTEELTPNLRALNQAQGDLLELGEQLPRAVNRIGNRGILNLQSMARIGGPAAAAGPVGALVGGAVDIGLSPSVQSRAAIIGQRLVDQGINEVAANRLAPVLARQAAMRSQRTAEEMDERIDREMERVLRSLDEDNAPGAVVNGAE